MSSTILVVEAEIATAQFLCDQLSADGYSAAAVGSVEAARAAAEELRADLVVVGAPSEPRGALALMAEVRAGRQPFDPDLPLLALTARADELDVVRAFAHGADDVMAKPFSYPELRARIAALLRRMNAKRECARIRVGDLEINIRSRTVRIDGMLVALTQREYELLVRLASEPERVFTKAELLRDIWGYRAPGVTRTLDSHACRLRDKLRTGGNSAWVVNVWGVGYALRQPQVGRAA